VDASHTAVVGATGNGGAGCGCPGCVDTGGCRAGARGGYGAVGMVRRWWVAAVGLVIATGGRRCC